MNRWANRIPALWLLLLVMGPAASGAFHFLDVTSQTGIDFVHTDGSSGRRYIIETVAAGLALFDYDGDGDDDIYFLNGAPLRGTSTQTTPRNRLYRNDGHWRFTDVTQSAGVGDAGYGLGVVAGDYDNDGDLDLYLNNFGPNVLYRNNGDGSFADVTEEAGVTHGDQVGAGTCFLDMDGDGDLDLIVANYLVFSYDQHKTLTSNGVPIYANPRFYKPAKDTVFRNNGDGTFSNVSESCGVGGHAGWGMGVVCADYDQDGDTDIFVANDVAENFLWQNDGAGRFTEVGLISGVAYDMHGDEQGSMGVDCADFNNDGRLDFFQTSYQDQLATLYQNMGGGTFQDVTLTTGAGRQTLAAVTWGTGLVDFDNDGDRDLFIAQGHLQDNIELYDDARTYHQKNHLMENTGNGSYVDVTDSSGPGMQVRLSSRGVGFADLDQDGDMDVVVLNPRQGPTLLRNDTPAGGNWLRVGLRGSKTNRYGVGARVKVVAGDLTVVDEVHSGRGYQSHYGLKLHFGLGKRERIDQIEVKWIGGTTDTYRNVEVNQEVRLVEGGGEPVGSL